MSRARTIESPVRSILVGILQPATVGICRHRAVVYATLLKRPSGGGPRSGTHLSGGVTATGNWLRYLRPLLSRTGIWAPHRCDSRILPESRRCGRSRTRMRQRTQTSSRRQSAVVVVGVLEQDHHVVLLLVVPLLLILFRRNRSSSTAGCGSGAVPQNERVFASKPGTERRHPGPPQSGRAPLLLLSARTRRVATRRVARRSFAGYEVDESSRPFSLIDSIDSYATSPHRSHTVPKQESRYPSRSGRMIYSSVSS